MHGTDVGLYCCSPKAIVASKSLIFILFFMRSLPRIISIDLTFERNRSSLSEAQIILNLSFYWCSREITVSQKLQLPSFLLLILIHASIDLTRLYNTKSVLYASSGLTTADNILVHPFHYCNHFHS